MTVYTEHDAKDVDPALLAELAYQAWSDADLAASPAATISGHHSPE